MQGIAEISGAYLAYVGMQEPMRNAADDPFSTPVNKSMEDDHESCYH
jgi:hypothetical protein